MVWFKPRAFLITFSFLISVFTCEILAHDPQESVSFNEELFSLLGEDEEGIEFKTKKHYSARPVYRLLNYKPHYTSTGNVWRRPYPLQHSFGTRNIHQWSYFPLTSNNIPQVLQNIGSYKLLDLIRKAGLEKTLEGKGPYTVFAPTDQAFNELAAEELTKDDLRSILLQHVVPQTIRLYDMRNEQVLDTASGNQIEIFETSDGFTVGGSPLLTQYSDNIAENGIIHVIEKVIYPYRASKRKEESKRRTPLDDIEE